MSGIDLPKQRVSRYSP